MSLLQPAASDVPGLYDVIINGYGYIFLRTIDTSLPFRTQRARYSHSPTFLTRQNVTGDYSDNQQDFWLTAAQRDWSLGEDQKFFKSADDEKSRQYYLGSNVNVSIPGQVTIERAKTSLTFAANVFAAGAFASGARTFASSGTNLYEVSSAGTISDRGAHGCGSSLDTIVSDGSYLYVSGSSCTKTRRFNMGTPTFFDFSSQPVDSLCFLNNTLYGAKNGILYTFSTSGTATNSAEFKDGAGGSLSAASMQIAPYGGKVAILRYSSVPAGPELWEYVGTGVDKLAEFPPNFTAQDFCVASGIIFVIGLEGKVGEGFRTAIYYYANGTIGRSWVAPNYTAPNGVASIAAFGQGVLFVEPGATTLRFYDLANGGASTVASYTPNADPTFNTSLAVANQYALMVKGDTGGVLLFGSAKASSAFVESSIIDFDSSLTKLFRGVIVDWVAATDGDGGSVDIAYQIDSVEGSYTTLQTGATSGQEYTFSSPVTGRGISYKVTLNKGTSTLGPTVKRVYVRAAPILQSYRDCEYILDLSGVNSKTPVILNDNETAHPLDGLGMSTNLSAAIASTSPITITDRFGSYTAIVIPDQSELIEVAPEEYIARVAVRQV